jgi:hypothetical protein
MADKIDFSFDFGFSAISEDELDAVQEAKTETELLSKKLNNIDNKALVLYNAILPLLENLKENPEKDFIRWPNRVQKIEQFEKKLKSILDS